MKLRGGSTTSPQDLEFERYIEGRREYLLRLIEKGKAEEAADFGVHDGEFFGNADMANLPNSSAVQEFFENDQEDPPSADEEGLPQISYPRSPTHGLEGYRDEVLDLEDRGSSYEDECDLFEDRALGLGPALD